MLRLWVLCPSLGETRMPLLLSPQLWGGRIVTVFIFMSSIISLFKAHSSEGLHWKRGSRKAPFSHREESWSRGSRGDGVPQLRAVPVRVLSQCTRPGSWVLPGSRPSGDKAVLWLQGGGGGHRGQSLTDGRQTLAPPHTHGALSQLLNFSGPQCLPCEMRKQ